MELVRRKLNAHLPSVAVDPELRERVDNVIKDKHVKIADFVRTAVLFYLETHYPIVIISESQSDTNDTSKGA